uniref:Uncharacterized protein n=1 Tax=Vespula pensylvanica TaxID=30213 RepID=A0A834KE69_VESPE|nr:hypothetical protein H0235_014971 [Vespula pensylvanica]
MTSVGRYQQSKSVRGASANAIISSSQRYIGKSTGAVMPEYLATLFWSYSWPGPRHPARYSAFALNSTTELPLQTSDLTSDREHDTIA